MPVAQVTRWQIPHRERPESARGWFLLAIAFWHAAEELFSHVSGMIHMSDERKLGSRLAPPILCDEVTCRINLHRHVRTLCELPKDLAAHGLLVKRRSRLLQDGSDDLE